MHFITVSLGLLALAGSTIALPRPPADAPTHTNEVQLCTKPNFSGQCYTFWSDTCVNLFRSGIGADFLNDNTRSIRMGPNTTCAFFKDPYCRGNKFAVSKDDQRVNVGKFYQAKFHWDSSISSFQCYRV